MHAASPQRKGLDVPARRYVGIVISWLGGMLALCAIIGVISALVSPLRSLLFLVVAVFGSWIFRAGRRMAQEAARGRIASDGRRPVVLLRAFSIDGRVAEKSFLKQPSLFSWMFGRASFEEQLSTIMENLGPTVALGRRGEVLPTFGFAREYVGDSEWRQVLGDYLNYSSWAVFLLDEITPNLAYEVAFVLNGHAKLRALLVPPPSDFRRDDWYAKYRMLRNSVVGLPEIEAKTAALIFDPSEGVRCIETGPGSGASGQLSAIRQALIPRYLYD